MIKDCNDCALLRKYGFNRMCDSCAKEFSKYAKSVGKSLSSTLDKILMECFKKCV